MRKIISVDASKPQPIRTRLGPGIRAYLFGSVATGKAGPDSDIDVYVAGPCADKIGRQLMWQRPPVIYDGRIRPLHIIGPDTIGEADFLKCQSEAVRLF